MNKRVLVVEDDKNLAESLKSIFVNKKLDVKISASGQTAEHLIRLTQFDLLVVDVVLPKMNGIDLIRQIISKGLLHSSCQIWLISGVLKKHIISTDIKGHIDEFIEKPLNLHFIEKKTEDLSFKPTEALKNMKFFYLNQSYPQNNLLKNQEYIIKGHELMFICFYLYNIRFNGTLSICYERHKDEILFIDGKMNNFKTEDKSSYLGALLIKHNMVSKGELESLLNQKTDKPLGEELVDNCYISPHQLNRILKEQLAIRLFKVMAKPSIVVHCQDFTVSQQFNQFATLEIKDYLSLINNWIHSKVTVKWLNGFFKSCANLHLTSLESAIHREQLVRYSQMDFFSQSIPSAMSIADFLAQKELAKGMRELYCRLLVRDTAIESAPDTKTVKNNYEFMEKKYKTFLEDANKKTYFELLNLPINAPIQKVEEVHKNMVKIFHPDRRSKDMPPQLVEICDQCFILVRKIHQTLMDPVKRQAYRKKIEDSLSASHLSTKEIYLKGKKNLTEGRYEIALNQFESIFKDKTSPGDAILYYISAKLKSMKASPSTKEKEQISHLFDRVSLEHRQSAMFYVSKGLFKKATGDKKSAFDLLTKAVVLDPKLTIARVERHTLSSSRKKRPKASPFLNLFKKGA